MADSFTDFVQNLFPSLGQVQQPMFTSPFVDPSAYRASPEAAAYYADPFRKQSAIQEASLDAALKQKEAEQAVQKVQGMLSGGEVETGLTQSQIDFLNNEALTPGARDARMSSINNLLTTAVPAVFGLPSPSMVSGLFNLGRQGVANMFNLSQQPAPVEDMSLPSTVSMAPNPFSDTAPTLGYGYGFDPEVGAPSSPGGGGGMSAADVAAASSDMSSLGDTQGAGSYW